jgi:hypothetical protein
MIGERAFDLTKILEITVLAIATAGFTGAFTAALIQHNPQGLNPLSAKLNDIQVQLDRHTRNLKP